MKNSRKIAIAGALCLTTLPLFAADGLLLVQQQTDGANTKTTQVQIEKDRMRAEMTGTDGEKQAIVFDATKQTLTIINVDKKSYSVLTKADVDAMGAQMSDARAQMQAQMAAMSPEQRAQMQAMMGRLGGAMAAAAPKTEYRKTGTDKVGRWTCDKYEGFENGKKVSELCTVDPAALGFTATDFDVAKRLQEFFKGMTQSYPNLAQQIFAPGTMEAQGYVGVPIRRTEYQNEKPQSKGELQQITRQSFAAATYEVPSGFKQEDSPMGGMGRGRGLARGRGKP
jgi:hypothetical protein